MQTDQNLAPYAAQADQSRGRMVPEEQDLFRTVFQRDRDRIIHSKAFRRLQNKTQVFVAHEGDHYRTRLTHTLEVAQIARNIARILRVNQDLTEAIALAHDLGHPPFAHKGEDVLDACMTPYGGFKHNDQTVRVVTILEHPYIDFRGLNLSFETIEGVVKHNGPALKTGESEDNLPFTINELSKKLDLELYHHAGIEAQIVDVADDTAYCAHDVEDGLRAGFFTLDDIQELALFRDIIPPLRSRWEKTAAPFSALVRMVIRAQMSRIIPDIVKTSQENLAKIRPSSIEDVRRAGQQIVAFSPALFSDLKELRGFLIMRMYRHYTVRRAALRAQRLLTNLFQSFMNDLSLMPDAWQQQARMAVDDSARARVIADYIAGMTDLFAIKEYQRLFDFDIDFR